MSSPRTRYAEGPGGRVAYQVVGEGPIDVLVSTAGLWVPIDLMWDEPRAVRALERMSSFCRHVWFDPRGRGGSDPIGHDEDRLIEGIVDDMVTVLDDLGWADANVLQIAGTQGFVFAATHPERVRSLALFNPAARLRSPSSPIGGSAEVPDLAETFRQWWGTGVSVDWFVPSLSRDKAFRRWAAKCERLSASRDEAYWRLRAAMLADHRAVLPAVHAPTLVVIRGTAETEASACEVADGIQGAKRVTVQGRDYVLFAGEDPNPVLDAVEEFLTGVVPQRTTDRVLATVMFVDIAGSTERVTDLGDRRWTDILSAFRVMVREQLARHRGREINTRGDDFLATFDGPGRAVRCAHAITSAARSLGVEVRSGLHAGEVELIGDDVGGIAVHIGARVAGIARAGEVLVSRTVVDLVAGSDLRFERRGQHSLKGLPGKWDLFAALR
jgi:class 3 adenylate cyclase